MQDITNLPRPSLPSDVRERLLKPSKQNGTLSKVLSYATQNPSVKQGQYRSLPNGNGNVHGNGGTKGSARRYYAAADDGEEWPPELSDYNRRFANTLEGIKRRHDGVVTTVGKAFSHCKRPTNSD